MLKKVLVDAGYPAAYLAQLWVKVGPCAWGLVVCHGVFPVRPGQVVTLWVPGFPRREAGPKFNL